MPMPPELKELFSDLVRFRAKGQTGRNGQATYGPWTAKKWCRFEYDYARRRVMDRGEDVSNAGTIYIDSIDFDPGATPVGSQVELPSGAIGTLSGIRPQHHPRNDPYGGSGVHHYELSVEPS